MKPISFWHRLLDFISPRSCMVCGSRLSPSEEILCARCNFHLPRTDFHLAPTDNPMARLFWHQIPIERATALFYYEPHAESARLIYNLKYNDHPEIGEVMGRLFATELKKSDFFDGIDYLIPVPLAKKRLRQRGYNQSTEIAKGVSAISGIPVLDNVIRRNVFEGSQTNKGRWERNENVANVFALTDSSAISNCHLLLIDDVVTTGATVIACAQQLATAPNVKVSVLALGFAKS